LWWPHNLTCPTTVRLVQTRFDVPFVCGCRDLGEGLRRIAEGAAMLRTKGEVRVRVRGSAMLA